VEDWEGKDPLEEVAVRRVAGWAEHLAREVVVCAPLLRTHNTHPEDRLLARHTCCRDQDPL